MSKFCYAYKSSDGARHTGALDAKNRESAFEALRSQGIRPIKVWEEEKPPLVRALRKALLVFGFVAGAAFLVYVGMTVESRKPDAPAQLREDSGLTQSAKSHSIGVVQSRAVSIVEPSIRRHLDGLELDETTLKSIFVRPSDRFLALYSQPGEKVVPPEMTDALRRDFIEGMRETMLTYEDDRDVHRDLKGVVAGMREELERFLKLGGTVDDYFTMLQSRQNAECDYKEKTYRSYRERGSHLAPAERESLRAALNATLKAMGIRLIPAE